MVILYSNVNGNADAWERELRRFFPDMDFRVYPDGVGNPAEIEFAVVWKHPPGNFGSYPKLRAILSLGAGVETIISDPSLPKHVPVVRLVDDVMSQDMAHHAVHWVLHFHRNYHLYPKEQAAHRWQRYTFTETPNRHVGILGLGEIGSEAARLIHGLGFPVAGWSRSHKTVSGIQSFHGADGLDKFLAQTNILVCVIPRTPETENLLDKKRLAQMPQGSFIINIGRGSLIVDDDLIAALDSGHIAGAALDVFHTEPLPADHPYWNHPKVFITPHIAGPTNQRSAARAVSRNIERVLEGLEPSPVVDFKRGY